MYKKITENVENISLLSDTPSLSPTELKKQFDKGSKTIKEHFNELIDDLNNNIEVPLDIITNGEPVKCGYKIDGRDVYVKRFDIGNLLNIGVKSVNSGLDFTKLRLENIKGICKFVGENNTTSFPLPYVNPNAIANCISVYIGNDNQVCVASGTDRTNYTAIVDVYFTYKDEQTGQGNG